MNCAALSRELVESELFGHEKGAFTGAIARREGKFEAADGGTLFLDEVGDMPLETQAKLLRALQEKEFERVGGNQPIRVDVRADRRHQPGSRGGRCGPADFREDLYYRLRVVELVASPRSPSGVRTFRCSSITSSRRPRHASTAAAKPSTADAMRACVAHRWKGNVRELRSAVEQALLLAPAAEITERGSAR